MNWTTDSTSDVLRFLRAHRIAIDPSHRGECERLADDPYIRRYYFARNGCSLDSLGEALWDARYTHSRLTPGELLDALDSLFFGVAQDRAQGKRPARKRATKQAEADAVKRARAMRLRKFACPECEQIARASRNASLRCGLCLEMALASAPPAVVAWFRDNAPAMVRVDPLPEEIMLASAMNAAECAA